MVLGCSQTAPVIGGVARPLPETAGEGDGIMKPLMLFHHVVKHGLLLGVHIAVVIIPIDQRKVAGNAVDDLLRHIHIGGVVAVALGVGTEEHITPDQRLQAILFTKLTHPFQVHGHQLRLFHIAFLLQAAAHAQCMGFIHADVDPAGLKAFTDRLEEGLDELIGLLLAHIQYCVGVLDVMKGVPHQRHIQVTEGLDAGGQGDAEALAVGNQLLQFCLGVATPLIAKIGILRHLEHILHVEHHVVIAHGSQPPDHLLDRCHVHGAAPGYIRHVGQPLVLRIFLNGAAGTLYLLDPGKTPEKLIFMLPADDGGIRNGDGKAVVPLRTFHHQTAIAFGDADLG